MQFKNLLLLGLSLCAQLCFAQTAAVQISLTEAYNVTFCSFMETKIPAQITGKFNSDNRFFVELLSTDDQKPVASYEAVFRDGFLVFTIADNKPDAHKQLHYRVASTSPVTKTDLIYSRPFYNRGEIVLHRAKEAEDTVNVGTDMRVYFDMKTNNTVILTMSDSSTHAISPSYYPQELSLNASKSTSFFVVKAVNTCNVPVPFSGTLPVTVNPISIIPLKVNNTTLCEGSEVALTYAVSGGTIPESATFRLRFFKGVYSENNERQTFEVPAVRIGNSLLTARIPEGILQYSATFQVAVIVDGPKLVSPYSGYFEIYPKPAASFRSQSDSVRIGEAFAMYLHVAGPEPYVVELNNGKSYSLDQNRNINEYPTKTETFSIRSLQTACGVTTDLPKQNVIATVRPGIRINAPIGKQWEICENQTLRLPFLSNTPLIANTKFIVEGSTFRGKVYQFEARLVNDSIEFKIPHSPAEWKTEGYFDINSFRVRTSNPSYISEYHYGFIIRGIPRLTYTTHLPTTLSFPQYFGYNITVSGGSPFSVVDQKGEQLYSSSGVVFANVFADASGNFGPVSAENSCYAASDVPKLNLTVNPYKGQEPVIVVLPPAQKYYCDPDSVAISFETLGKFGEGNVFQITNHNSAPLLTVDKAGRYQLPRSAFEYNGDAYIQVKSTNPQVQGAMGVPLIIDTKPQMTYPEWFGHATAENPQIFQVDETPNLSFQVYNHSPQIAKYSDGIQDYDVPQESQYNSFYPVMPRSKVVPYVLKSITNNCGTTAVNQTRFLYWKSYNLALKFFTDGHVYCVGEAITVPFNVEKGTAASGTTFYLQVKKGQEEFKTIASNTTGEDFKYIIPDSMEGEYNIRVMADTFTETPWKRIIVNKKPTATLAISSFESPDFTGEISYGQSAMIEYKLTGGGPWQIILDGRGEISTTEATFTRPYPLSQAAQFQLQSVSNQCGYGSVSGSVTVKVKPVVVSIKPEKTVVCSGNALNVKYQVAGDIPSGEKIGFYLRNFNGSKFELPSVTATSGTVSLPISSSLRSGNYDLICYITGSEVSLSEQIVITKAPDIELTGYTTINPGDFTFIHIRPKSEANQPVKVTLSDGTSETVNPWGVTFVQSIKVNPFATTTYNITSTESACGAVQFSGSATVVVNPISERKIRVTDINKYTAVCARDTLKVYFTKSGTFSPENRFLARLFDEQGKLAKELATSGSQSPLQVIIPSDLLITESYRIKIIATDANTASSDYPQAIWFGTRASASFTSAHAGLDKAGKAQAVVKLDGTGPWQYSYGNDLGAINRYADISPDTISITSSEPSVYFKLLTVSNSCGNGTISEPSVIKVEVILGAPENDMHAGLISVGPNPTNGLVTVRFKTNVKRQLTLYRVNGTAVWTKTSTEEEAVFNMEQYPPGVYLLKLENKGNVQIFKIVKQ